MNQEEFDELMARCYNFDDKPHQLFSFLKAMVDKYDFSSLRPETLRVMEWAYKNAGRMFVKQPGETL